MDKNKILKYLIPVIAVVVLIESVVLISKLGDRQGVQIQPDPVSTSNLDTTTEQVKPEDAIYELVLSADKKDIKLGEKAVVELRMKALSTRSVDAINAYLKYDTAAFEASNLTFDTKLPKPAFEKISTLRSMVVANFLVTEPKGLMLNEGEEVTVMKFDVSPKMTGSFDFEISTGDDLKESVTMIVENTTAEVLPYVSNKLTINVMK
jgi:hypothetical protein